MLSIFQARYQRVDKALNTLIESIAAYNPSVSAADELVAADDEVNESLEQLATHHANYARILSLRQTVASLDENIKSIVRMLAETRKDLRNIPTTAEDSVVRDVQVDELLPYAKFISKTTVPPTFRRPVPKEILSATADRSQTEITNGMATPAAVAQDVDSRPVEEEGKGVATTALSQETKAMLDPLSQLPFVPWPSQDVISAGALAQIQGMIEDGRDPNTVLTQEEQEAEDKRKADEVERLRLEEEERLRKRRESMFALGSMGRHTAAEDVFDPDEA